ncbi:MAG TPA: hypothetical protein VMI53_10330 [Opitutaceae bacterium]|nr:hypothetical protein [Opitutaceae bacterium]
MISRRPIEERLLALRSLVEVMTDLSGPPPLVLPSPPVMGEDGAQLARESAASAVAIANATAALGIDGNDQKNASVLWDETIKQMERIQRLYHLPPYPFQSRQLP